MKRFVVILFVVPLVPLLIFSQYYSTSSSLEKRFEQQALYFSPSYINPYGVDEFSSALPGVIDHPLLNLQVNPATLSLLEPQTYFYVDYRTNKKLERYTGDIYPMLNSARSSFTSDVIPYYPFYHSSSTKLSVEPAFSSALIGKPMPVLMPELSLGVSYELISQSESYYPIENLYPYPWDSRAMMDGSYEGVNFVRNNGHSIALFSSYQLSEKAAVGLRIGRSLFNRDGEHGPLINSSSGSAYSDYSFRLTDRGQNYQLWDATVGLHYSLLENIAVGGVVGYSTGDVTQTELYNNTGISWSNEVRTNSYNTLYNRDWRHNGDGISIGANARVNATSSLKFNAVYSYIMQRQDIFLYANESDNNNYEFSPYRSGSEGMLNRNGSGDFSSSSNRFSLAVSLETERKIALSFGVVFSRQDVGTKTNERVISKRTSYSQDTTQLYTAMQIIDDRAIAWTANGTKTDVQIPLLVALPINTFLTLHIGFNRRFLTIEEEEQTSIRIVEGEQYKDGVLIENTTNQRHYNNTPKTNRTTNRLSLLAGFTIQPSEIVEIRLTAIPYSLNDKVNLQWLAGVDVLP